MLDAGRLLTAGELGLDRKLGRGTSKQETLTVFLTNAHNFLARGTYISSKKVVFFSWRVKEN
jgi:hypothetical protein